MAFTGVDLIRKAYQTAVEEQYRFFSLGDACLML
jgi:S-adenosylmethionine:tRNA-ribosyltransferase-isomerase (queuine synthetase)